MKIIIKITLLFTLALAVFIGIKNISNDKGVVASLDDWLDQFQEPVKNTDDEHEENDDESDDEDDDDVPSRVEYFKGMPAVRLSNDVIERSGIQLGSLSNINYQSELTTVAKVIDIQDLFHRRATYQQASFDLNLASQGLRATSRIYERLLVLHKEQANISLRQVEEARAKMNADRTRVAAAKQSMQSIEQQAQLKWGTALTSAALQTKKTDAEIINGFERLSNLTDVLLLVTLPTALTTTEKGPQVFVNVQAERATAKEANYISPARQTNAVSQGQTYYYQVSASNFRLGMSLHVWLLAPEQKAIEHGVDVPQDAVVWYGNSAWIYVKVGDELYSRRPIQTEHETDTGWFVQDRLTAGDRIVTKGAQLLLSEEQRWRIPDEDDD